MTKKSQLPKKDETVLNESKQEETEKKSGNELTQAELDNKLKEEAVLTDFVEMNVDNPPANKKLKATGTITFITKEGSLGSFTLTTEEGDGYGLYEIENYSLTDVQNGQEVTF